jgi:hypothetical protein
LTRSRAFRRRPAINPTPSDEKEIRFKISIL